MGDGSLGLRRFAIRGPWPVGEMFQGAEIVHGLSILLVMVTWVLLCTTMRVLFRIHKCQLPCSFRGVNFVYVAPHYSNRPKRLRPAERKVS